jgi:hypothetical protein
MHPGYDYETHRTLAAVESRHHERALEHRRALKAKVPASSVLDRMMSGLGWLRPVTLQPAGTVSNEMTMTDRACRPPGGGLGRIALCRSEDGIVEESVPA